RCVVQIPYEAMHAGITRKRSLRADPVPRNLTFIFWRRDLVGAGVSSNEVAGGIENLECYRRRSTQVVIDDGSVGRILPGRLVRRQRRVGVLVPSESPRAGRFEEEAVAADRLPERLDVIEDPESSPVCRGDEIVLVESEIAD